MMALHGPDTPHHRLLREIAAAACGLAAVLLFSLTLPATRWALRYLDPQLVGPGRGFGAALVAVTALAVRRWRWERDGSWLPAGGDWPSVLGVGLGTVIGFPWLSTLALRHVPAAHGAVWLGLLPLLTSGLAAWRGGERPTIRFWLAAVTGSAVVVAFAMGAGAGRLQAGDGLLLGAMAVAALGHAEGGRLARRHGGLRAIGWGLVLALPVTGWPVLSYLASDRPAAAPASAWLAFAYISLGSQLLGFVLWYGAMALGGVARTSQFQLLQPFFTILAAQLWLDEPLSPPTVGTAVLVGVVVAAGRRAPAGHRARRSLAPLPFSVARPRHRHHQPRGTCSLATGERGRANGSGKDP